LFTDIDTGIHGKGGSLLPFEYAPSNEQKTSGCTKSNEEEQSLKLSSRRVLLSPLKHRGMLQIGQCYRVKAIDCFGIAVNRTAGLHEQNYLEGLECKTRLGFWYISQRNYDVAEELFSRSLDGWLRAAGKQDLLVITARSHLAVALQFQGHLNAARSLFEYVYKKRCHLLGRKHHETLKARANLAMVVNEMGQHVQAEKMYREVLRDCHRVLDRSHPDVLKIRTNLASALHDQERYCEAEMVVGRVLPLIIARHGTKHSSTLLAFELRAILLHHMLNFGAALSISTHLVRIRTETLGYYHEDTQRNIRHMMDLRTAVT
jgi:tetratricopeptide (TPR) repeat protein